MTLTGLRKETRAVKGSLPLGSVTTFPTPLRSVGHYILRSRYTTIPRLRLTFYPYWLNLSLVTQGASVIKVVYRDINPGLPSIHIGYNYPVGLVSPGIRLARG